jgi:hypothetical protein
MHHFHVQLLSTALKIIRLNGNIFPKYLLLNIPCVSKSGDFATMFFLVRQHWGGCRYRHFAANFKAFKLQWSRGLEHNVFLL